MNTNDVRYDLPIDIYIAYIIYCIFNNVDYNDLYIVFVFIHFIINILLFSLNNIYIINILIYNILIY